jgi:hypothetical protein
VKRSFRITRGSNGSCPCRSHRRGPARSRLSAAALGALILVALLVGIEGGTGASAPAEATRVARAPSESLESKIRELSIPASERPASYKPIVITQEEATTYLRNQGSSFLPPAVENPEIEIHHDHVSGVAEVDFDKLQQFGKQNNDIGAQVLGTLFKGRQKVSASGKLQSGDGQCQLTIQDLSIGSTSIPDWLTQALLQNYLEKTYKLDLTKPFPLPDHVTRIDLADGQATFVRSPSKKTPPSKSTSN